MAPSATKIWKLRDDVIESWISGEISRYEEIDQTRLLGNMAEAVQDGIPELLDDEYRSMFGLVALDLSVSVS